ncbi:MAG: type 1 glutamine amidotransferase [Endomicrobiaceae bacterium]|nr:type 1 glutamine amidotransferase [Endomicrobiaceae bacterium]
MRIHYLQHVPFEGLGSIECELKKKGHKITSTKLYNEKITTSLKDIDWLIIMGGPMGIYDDEIYPWLKEEKQFIKEAVSAEKIVLGICLGAQLIADVLGAKVYKNKYREIGWFPLTITPETDKTILSNVLPNQFEAFHWHGDTFDIPKGAVAIAESDACKNQGFIFNNRVLALQFHLETTPESATALVKNCADELDGSHYVQSEDQISENPQKFSNINKIMSNVLNAIENNNLKNNLNI